MDTVFKSRLTRHFVFLINHLDANTLLPYLQDILTQATCQLIASEPTALMKAECLVKALTIRPSRDMPVFIDALRKTHHSLVADVLENIIDPSAITNVSSDDIFSELRHAVLAMEPSSLHHERHGKIFITSTRTYIGKSPTSAISEITIPFLIASKTGRYATKDILSWPLAPSKDGFDRFQKIYTQELDHMKRLLSDMTNFGLQFYIFVSPHCCKKIKALVNNYKYAVINEQMLGITFNPFDMTRISPIDLDMTACLLHLMCFGQHSFMIKKVDHPKPNTYLLCNVNRFMMNSPVVDDRDKHVVLEAVELSETSAASFIDTSVRCPW